MDESRIPSAMTGITVTPPGHHKHPTRRARANIRGTRANTLPEEQRLPGERIFRINPDSKIGRATLRRWGRRHGYKVSGKGKIPAEVRDAFMAENNIWTVRERTTRFPGPTGDMVTVKYYQVKQGGYLVALHSRGRTETIDPFYVQRVLGKELFNLLQEVKS